MNILGICGCHLVANVMREVVAVRFVKWILQVEMRKCIKQFGNLRTQKIVLVLWVQDVFFGYNYGLFSN